MFYLDLTTHLPLTPKPTCGHLAVTSQVTPWGRAKSGGRRSVRGPASVGEGRGSQGLGLRPENAKGRGWDDGWRRDGDTAPKGAELGFCKGSSIW